MEEKYIKLSDAKKAIEDYRSGLTVSKYGSLEACMDAKFAVTGAMKELDYIPPADVVPKSEVERLQAELEDKQFRCDSCDRIGLTHSEHIACIKQAKAEFAREIFAEIEKYKRKPLPECKNTYVLRENELEELKKKCTEEET